MGATNREITVYSCDADGCKVAKPVIDGGHYPESFITGMVNLTSDPEGPVKEWAACKVAHIGKAVTAVKAAGQPDREETEDDGHDNEPPAGDGAAASGEDDGSADDNFFVGAPAYEVV